MAPTKHGDKDPAASASSAHRTKVICLSCRVKQERGRRGDRQPASVAAVLASADQLHLYYLRRRREHLLRALFLELSNLAIARRRESLLLRRVPGPTEDSLAAMMAQLTTTTTPAGGDRAATVVPPSATSPAAADDQSSALGEMFDKMVLSSDE